MRLSCAFVLTLTNLVIANAFSFSAPGSGVSSKAEAVTSPFGQYAVVKPVASKTSGFSGSFSKASSANFASSSSSSSSSAFNYNAGQVSSASHGYGTPGLPKPSHTAGHYDVTVPQTTAFATSGSNVQAEASINTPATGSYINKPNSYAGSSSGVTGHWHQNSKPNSFNVNANVPEHSEIPKESSGVQSFSNKVQSSTGYFSTPSTPSEVSGSVEKVPSYTGGFGGPPGILIPHDKISTVGSNAPGQNAYLSYQPGAQSGVTNKQQSLIYTPVSTTNPSYAQNEGPTGQINPTVQSINNEYVYQTENSKPSYKPETNTAYSPQNKPTASSSYEIYSSGQKPSDGQYVSLQQQSEVSHTAHKELEQIPHSVGQYSSHSKKPSTNSHTPSNPVKNIQIFIQSVPSSTPQTPFNPVHFTNTHIGSESNKEVRPNSQYIGGFSALTGISKPSGQSVSSNPTFSSSAVQSEHHESFPSGLTTTGAKETTYGTGLEGKLHEIKGTAQPQSVQNTNYQSVVSGASSGSYVTPKPSSPGQFASTPASVSTVYFSSGQKNTEQFFGKPSESSLPNPTVSSSWVHNPTTTSLPIRPEFEVQKKPIGPISFNTQETSLHSHEHGFGGVSVSIDKTKPTAQSDNFGEVSEDVKPTSPSTNPNNAFDYSSSPYKPVVTPAPFNPNKPNLEITNQKESAFVSFTTTQATPVNSWQHSTYKPSFEGLSAGSSTPGFSDNRETTPTKYPSLTGDNTVSKQSEKSPTGTYSNVASHFQAISNSETAPSEYPPTAGFSVSKEIYKVPTQIVSNNAYPAGSVASVFNPYPNSETSQSQSNSEKYHQSSNYEATASFVTQKPTTSVNFVGQTNGAVAGLTSTSFSQQSNKPTVESTSTTSYTSGSFVSSNVSPTQKPLYTGSYGVSKETQTTPTETTNTVYPTISIASVSSSNTFSGKPQTQSGVSQQSVEYQPTSSLVTREPTASVNPTFTTDYTDSKETQNTPSVPSSSVTSSGGPTTFTTSWSSGKPQYQFPTKPTPGAGIQKQPLYSNTFGTLTGAVKPLNYPFSNGPSYVTASNDKPKQTIYFNQNKPTASSFPEKKETLTPSKQPYPNGNINIASNVPTTAKPFLTVAPLNVVQQSTSSLISQKEKESTFSTSGSSTAFSKVTQQPIQSNSGVSSTSFATSKPAKPTSQLFTSNSAFSSFGSSSLSQVKPQYQFSTIQPVTQKKQWHSNNYGTFGTVKPNSYTYPGFTSSFTTFGQGSSTVGGLYDKTKQTTQYTSTSQYKPTSTGQYSPSLTGQYKPASTGQYKPTYNWGFAGQSGSQKPSNQPTQTESSNIYSQTTSKPTVASSSFDKVKPTTDVSVVGQKESSFSSSFASDDKKSINQPLFNEKHESHQISNTGSFASSVAHKPTPSESSHESVTGNPFSNEGKVTSTFISTTQKYDLQKPVSPTGQTYLTPSFISAKPTAVLPTKVTPQQNKPLYTYIEQVAPSSNAKEPSYATYTGVASSNLNPSSPSADKNHPHFVDKTQTVSVKPAGSIHHVGQTTSSVSTGFTNTGFPHVTSGSHSSQKPLNQFNIQVDSPIPSSINPDHQSYAPVSAISESSNTNQTPIPTAQKNPSFSSNQQSSQQVSSDVIYQGNTQFQSTSQVQPTNWPVDPTHNTPKKPGYQSAFGESSVQLTPSKQGSLEVSSIQKESVSSDYYVEKGVHSKPSNTPYFPTPQSDTVVDTVSASPSPAYGTEVKVDSKPNKIQYISPTVPTAYKPTSVVSTISSYSEQQTAIQATKPNIKVTVVGKPSSTNVGPSYAGGFGGPAGILKPNEFSISSNQGNTQSQYQIPSHNYQTVTGSYSGAKVGTSSNTASYTGGFGGPSGVLIPGQTQSTINHAVHDKPTLNGFHSSLNQGSAQASYNVVPNFGVQAPIKEQASTGAQISTDVQGSAAANAATNASGFVNGDVSASSNGFDKTSNTFGGQFGETSGFNANAKESASVSKTSSAYQGFTGRLSPQQVLLLLGKR